MTTAASPEHLVSDVVLRDGSTVRIRPDRPGDETVEDYQIGLSPETATAPLLVPINRRPSARPTASSVPRRDYRLRVQEALVWPSRLAITETTMSAKKSNPPITVNVIVITSTY